MKVEMKGSGSEWIGQIPKTWNKCRLKYLFHIKKEIANQLGYDILSVTQKGIRIKDITSNEGQISQDYSKYQIVKPFDYVMNHMDLLTGFVDLSKIVGVTSPDYRVFSSLENCNIDLRYYLYIFQYCYQGKVFYGLGQGVSNLGRWRLQTDKFLNFDIPYIPFNEQQKIVNFLDDKCADIDQLIALQQQMIDELKAYKQSVITEAVCKGLDKSAPMKDSGIEWIGEVPEGWRKVKLKNLCRKMNSGTNLTTEEISEEGIYPVYGGNGIRGYYNNFNQREECLLIGRQGALCGNLKHTYEPIWATEHAVITLPNELADINYLYYLLIAMNLNQYSISAAQPGLAVGFIQNVSTICPPIEDQKMIASYIETKSSQIDTLISIKQQKIDELKEYKKSMIYEYITGKKQVPENNIRPLSNCEAVECD